MCDMIGLFDGIMCIEVDCFLIVFVDVVFGFYSVDLV